MLDPVAVCHRCEFRGPIVNGKPVYCTVSGRTIEDHAQQNKCPNNFFAPAGAAQVIHGAVGIAKAITRIGRPTQSAIDRRAAICNTCEHAVMSMGVLQRCGLCNCITWAKVRNAAEKCPDTPPRWDRIGKTTVVVQPALAGDILSLLPAMKRLHDIGQKVYHVVHRDFLPIVRGLSYVEPIIYDGPYDRPADAAKLADHLDAEIIIAQRWGNPHPINAGNFQLEPWARLGMADRFDAEPLVLDNRDPLAEQRLCEELIGEDRRPLLLINTAGTSSPYDGAAEFLRWVSGRWGRRCKIIDLGGIRAARFQDLLGLYERAAVLISTDTGTLHLGYAVNTPTIGLVRDDANCASILRPHWLARMTYRESRTDRGRERIATAVERQLAKRTRATR